MDCKPSASIEPTHAGRTVFLASTSVFLLSGSCNFCIHDHCLIICSNLENLPAGRVVSSEAARAEQSFTPLAWSRMLRPALGSPANTVASLSRAFAREIENLPTRYLR